MRFGDRTIVRNPDAILREDLPDAPILFDPQTDQAFNLNPTAVLVWKNLDECPSMEAMRELLDASLSDVPAGVEAEIHRFLDQLLARGLAAEIT
jgi:hypothetical protein